MKMIYGSLACEVSAASDFSFSSQVTCSYERDTVRYAAELFLRRSTKFRRACTYESWQIRIAKGKERRKHRFAYLIPAVLMELPGAWVRITGSIDAVGVKIERMEILKAYPELDERIAL